MNYYALLHVHPDAPVEIIRASFRTLMQVLKQHPDLGGDKERAQLINEAYSVLSDPDRRARYDADCARLGSEAASKRSADDESSDRKSTR